ncbi:hypothetical protein MLD38_017403 [Melastoma candidum]|nr:hypothetical protein MLD38_017403 [Melastoma candidum]
MQRSRRSGTGSPRKDISRQLSYLEMQIPSCSWEILSHNGKWKYEEASSDICADVGGQISEELIDDLIVQLSCTSS